MDWKELVRALDAETAQRFVVAARHVLDALLLEAERLEGLRTPPGRDYQRATLPRATPPGGWLRHDELRDTARRIGAAVASEKWTDGVVETLRFLAQLGALG